MTRFSQSTLESPTGATLAVYRMEAERATKGIVHINHGMSEHAGRYERFARALCANGYHVIAQDHRGHGQTTAPDTHQGLYAAADGWHKVIADVMAVNAHARTLWPGLPIICFGHSMGAIIGVNICMRHSDDYEAAAIWNSGVDGGALLAIYGALLAIERMFKGSDVPSAIASKLTFETWNKNFAPNRTPSDWLSRDEAEVDKYIADPLCGFDACNGLWRDLLSGIRAGADDRELAKIRSGLPMHLLAGGKDPCTANGKAVERLAQRLRKSGVSDVTFELHPDNRHEALNELSRETITQDFIAWLDKRFA